MGNLDNTCADTNHPELIITHYFSVFSDLKDKVWYLGMVDSHKSSLFSWMDGNLFSYSNFGDEEPSSVDICVKDHASGYLWASVHCSEKMYVICKTTKSKCLNVI